MKAGGIVLGTMVLLTAVVLVSPLLAGDLNPPGSPAPTMKSLDQISPTWDQVIPNAADRFKLVMGGAAVLDKETGVVWEQSPSSTILVGSEVAKGICAAKRVGNRMGWRLPTVQELASLLDQSQFVYDPMSGTVLHPALPAGYEAFFNVPVTAIFWSATHNVAPYNNEVFTVSLMVFFGGAGPMPTEPDSLYFVWCVRGGRGTDSQ